MALNISLDWVGKNSEKLSEIYTDSRASLEQLFSAFSTLGSERWIYEPVMYSKTGHFGQELFLPIPCLRTKASGKALWLISGIHGEEPAGPNALANLTTELDQLAGSQPAILLPLCNPVGYLLNQRYLNSSVDDYKNPEKLELSAGLEFSVGDSEHLLLDLQQENQPRIKNPTSAEAAALTKKVLELALIYPPLISVDLHEDNQLSAGYIYSQGHLGRNDPLARKLVTVLQTIIPIQETGTTRFAEPIVDGIVGKTADGSIDELIAAEKLYYQGRIINGPNAPTVLVVETPARMPLAQRIFAQQTVLRTVLDQFKDNQFNENKENCQLDS